MQLNPHWHTGKEFLLCCTICSLDCCLHLVTIEEEWFSFSLSHSTETERNVCWCVSKMCCLNMLAVLRGLAAPHTQPTRACATTWDHSSSWGCNVIVSDLYNFFSNSQRVSCIYLCFLRTRSATTSLWTGTSSKWPALRRSRAKARSGGSTPPLRASW